MSIFGLKADAELQSALRKHASGTKKRYAASGRLFRQGDKPNGFYLIESGRAHMFMEAANGNSLFEEVIDSGSVVGLPATVNGHPYNLSCEVVADTEVLFISHANLVTLMRGDTDSAMKLLDLLCSEVQAVRAELGNFANRNSDVQSQPR